MEHSHHSTELPKEMSSKQPSALSKYFLIGVAAIVLLVIGFGAGVKYQKDHSANSHITSGNLPAGSGAGGRFGRFVNGQRPIFGQVTAISPSSISVQDNRSGTTSTLSITSSTTITDNGQTASASDIQSGDTVIVFPSSGSSTQAGRIMVDPSFGGGQNNSSSEPNGSSTSEPTSTNSILLN